MSSFERSIKIQSRPSIPATCLLVLIVVLPALFSRQAMAQTAPGPDVSVGVDPKLTYSSTDVDSVDPMTGRLSIHIPLLQDHSQRGNLNFSYSLAWSGIGDWNRVCMMPDGIDTVCEYIPSSPVEAALAGPVPVMDHGLGGLNGEGGTGLMDSEGIFDRGDPCFSVDEAGVATHPVQGALSVYFVTSCPDGDNYSIEAVDGSKIQFKRKNNSEDTAETVLTNSSGVQFHYLGSPDSPQAYVEDADGNQITISQPDGGADVDFGTYLFTTGGTFELLDAGNYAQLTGPMWTMTDTLDRSWGLNYSTADLGSCPAGTISAMVWSTPGVAGVNGGVRPFTFCYSAHTLNATFDTYDSAYNPTVNLLTEAILPDGTSYGFHYDPDYGDLTELDLPTGGKITYAYTTTLDPCDDTAYIRTLTQRTVYDNVNLSPQPWTYSLSNSGTMTVTNPIGGQTVYTHPYSEFGVTCNPQTTTAYYEKNGTLVKTDTGIYSVFSNPFGYLGNLYLPAGTMTTWGTDGPTTETETTPDSPGYSFQGDDPSGGPYITTYTVPYGMTTSTTVSGYGSSLSSTTSYLALYDSTYLAANLLNLPLETTVQGMAGSDCSDTLYSYDNTGYIVSSGISTQHDTSVTPLGNLTTVTQQAFDTACQFSGGSTSVISHRYVYDTGMLEQSVDPKGNPTTYTYSTGGTYPTAVTNALGQSQSYGYDANTGLVTSSTDANGQQTSYGYDNMLRPVQANYPDGGQETWTATYSSNVYLGSTYTKKITASSTYTEATKTDGMGRTIQTQLTDPQGTDSTDYTYDALGRPASVSNPYRSTSDPTYGVTSYAYDVLNRMRLETNPDGSSKQWIYGQTEAGVGGATVTFNDENGLETQQTLDAAGRLTKVLEQDDYGLNIETDYTYDPLNDLIEVVQQGHSGDTARVRTFSYDGLSRLTSARNPESGTTTYAYDADSNPLTKTDARGVVATYSYDALNRLTGKSYSDGTTPSVAISYDTPSSYAYTANNANNFVGRMSQVTTSDGETVLSSKYISGYDPMGRQTGFIECGTYSGDCAASGQENAFSADYAYDLAGNVINLDTGIGSLGELYPENADQTQYRYFSYDAVNRLSTAEANTDLSAGSQQYQVLSNGAAGPMLTANYPDQYNNAQISVTRAYDNRERILSEEDDDANGGAYAYYLDYQANNDLTYMADGVMGTWLYNYNDRNQLISGVAMDGNYAGLTLNWTYDSFGNRTSQTPSGTYTGPAPAAQTVTYNANNQVASGLSLTYDGAGNVTDDGTNRYLYDGEGRLCAVNAYTGTGAMTGYVYDGDGNRVAKGGLSSFSCDTTSNGFTLSNAYTLGQSGEQLEETDQNGVELHANTFAEGKLFYTYDDVTSEWAVALNDRVGTKRVQVNPAILANQASFTSLPYGDGYTASGYDSTEQHFTGKQWDKESNLDDFGARYYSKTMGRFMSPDSSDDPEPVPYADYTNPQSLNLYSYVLNNPLTNTDADGHGCDDDSATFGQDTIQDDNGTTTEAVTVNGGCNPLDMSPNLTLSGNPLSQDTPPVPQVQRKPVAPRNEVPQNPCQYGGRALPPSAYAAQGQAANGSLVNFTLDVTMGFPRGDFLDAQPLASGNPLQREAYGNYAFGVYMAAAGVPLSAALSGGNAYAFFSGAQYPGRQMDSNYPSLPAANVANITNGFNAQMTGTTCQF